ncbi:hypothetical protein [Acaryochloris thomasi]|nr:hypothetical protein [Acaryochloris thomasi]
MLLPFNISARAAEIHQAVSQQCVLQIEATEKRLLEVSTLNLVEAGTDKYSDSEPGRPVYATHSVYFTLEKEGGENLMNSPVLMKSLSTALFAQCNTAGSVVFGFNKSDWSETFGKMTDGTIQKFDCAEDPTQITWGTQPCL